MSYIDELPYLYGKLNKEVERNIYKGDKTDTAVTTIDNGLNVITVDVNPSVLLNSVKIDTSSNEMVFSSRLGTEISRVQLSGFQQEQSNLAETDPASETFVKNKSTRYLSNEGANGNYVYAEIAESDLQDGHFLKWDSVNKIISDGGTLNLENGTGTGSLVQKRLKSDGVTWTTAKAYQGAGAALGGGTQAGMTFEEWKNDNPTGTQEDYDKSYSFAFAANEDNKALARGSAAFGRYNTAHNIGEFVCGNYADNNRDPRTVFAVGTGIDDSRRSTGFEVRTDGYCYIHNKAIATEEYVDNSAVKKMGNSYVLYANESGYKSTVIPYRFNKQSIIDAELPLMFQPMIDGRLYTRDPEDDYHAANKRFVEAGLEGKLDKTGGTISGKMFFYNNLSVIGGRIYCNMTPTQDTEVVRLAELNTRLKKPSDNPTEDSFVKVSSTGSTSYMKVSELDVNALKVTIW